MKSVIILILAASCLAQGSSPQGSSPSNWERPGQGQGQYGGYRATPIDDQVRLKVADLVAQAAVANDANLAAVSNANPDLIFYSSKMVAGAIHVLGWKVEGLEAPYFAAKIWSQPWASVKFRVITAFGQTQEEVLDKVSKSSFTSNSSRQ